MLLAFNMASPMVSICLFANAAGPTVPNPDPYYGVIAALDPGKFKWNGIPHPNFREMFWDHMRSGLGTISENGSTLLETALGTDIGGSDPRATVLYINATNQQRSQHDARIRRLFCTLLTYISATCYLYRLIITQYRNDGIAAFEVLQQYGSIPYSAEQIRRFENEWDELTMRKYNIPISFNAPYILAERICYLARRLNNKTKAVIKTKFLHALPHECKHIQSTQRGNINHVGYAYPANYPVVGVPSHLHGVAHPHAGQPDLMRMVRHIHPEWIQMIFDKLITGAPRVMSMIEDDSSEVFMLKDPSCPTCDIPEIPSGDQLLLARYDKKKGKQKKTNTLLAIAAKSIHQMIKDGKKVQCIWCGGDNHVMSMELEDGTMVICSAKTLGLPQSDKGKAIAEGLKKARPSKSSFRKRPGTPTRRFKPQSRGSANVISDDEKLETDSQQSGTESGLDEQSLIDESSVNASQAGTEPSGDDSSDDDCSLAIHISGVANISNGP